MWIQVARLKEFEQNNKILIELEEGNVIIIKDKDQYFAIEDRCPHKDLPLFDGCINEGKIICPFHDAEFCISSGKVLKEPAKEGIKTFATKIENEFLFIQKINGPRPD